MGEVPPDRKRHPPPRDEPRGMGGTAGRLRVPFPAGEADLPHFARTVAGLLARGSEPRPARTSGRSCPSVPNGNRSGGAEGRGSVAARFVVRIVHLILNAPWGSSFDKNFRIANQRSRSLLPGTRPPGGDRRRQAQALELRRNDAVASPRGVLLLRSRRIADALRRGAKGRTGGVPCGELRLSQQRGVATTGCGNHRGSVFRLLVGTALMGRDPACSVRTWGERRPETKGFRAREIGLERLVSRVIGEMPLLWLRVDGPAGSASLRGYIERNSIALLRNYDREPLDPASGNWLGLHCPKDKVRRSGLWNRRHV